MISIHRIVLRRLLAAWFVLTLLVGGTTYFIQLEKVDDAVVALAAKYSADFAPEGLNTGTYSGDELRQLQRKAEEFVKSHFVVIEVYDRDKNRILETVNPAYEHIEAELKLFKHSFPLDGGAHYEKFSVGDDMVVQVLVPLPSKRGGNAGFFEGVFVVDRDTLQAFRQNLWHTLIGVLVAVLATTILLYPVIIGLNRDVIRFSSEVLKGNLEIASVLGAAIAKRDSDTGDHNYRVTLYAIRLGQAAGLDATAMRQLILGAFLHDVGKIGISDTILLKPGRLTAAEFDTMRTHVALGVDIVAQSAWLHGARDVIEFHHEKYDGSGYLRGLKGENIPLNARIFSIVDVFDALTSRRPYKAPMSVDEALAIIRQDAGSHFDPQLVDYFVDQAAESHAAIGSASEAQLQEMLREQAADYFMLASIAAGK